MTSSINILIFFHPLEKPPKYLHGLTPLPITGVSSSGKQAPCKAFLLGKGPKRAARCLVGYARPFVDEKFPPISHVCARCKI
jgi:hypothetical protein